MNRINKELDTAMHRFAFRSALALAAAAVALAACGGHGAIPPQLGAPSDSLQAPQSQAFVAPARESVAILRAERPIRVDTAKHPCQIRSMWYFRGACVETTVKRGSGTTISLPAYKGLTMVDVTGPLQIPAVGSGKPVGTLIVGEGTSRKDITGILGSGSNAFGRFPIYHGNCLDHSGNGAPCPKPLLYFDNFNNGSTPISFGRTPALTITDKSKAGVTCGLELLVRPSSSGPVYWWQMGLQGTFDKHGVLEIPYQSYGSSTTLWNQLPPNGYFETYSVGCNK